LKRFILFSLYSGKDPLSRILILAAGKTALRERRAKEKSMKNRLVSMGMLAGLLACGLLMFGCESNGSGGGGSGGGGGGDSAIVARWYDTQPEADAEGDKGFEFEFKANGSGTDKSGDTFTYTAEHSKITIKIGGITMNGTYVVNGTQLTLLLTGEDPQLVFKKA
jgi:hypothetical protein